MSKGLGLSRFYLLGSVVLPAYVVRRPISITCVLVFLQLFHVTPWKAFNKRVFALLIPNLAAWGRFSAVNFCVGAILVRLKQPCCT